MASKKNLIREPGRPNGRGGAPVKKKRKKKKRKTMRFEDLPRFPDGLDRLPSPAEIDGRRKTWVGIGWVDEGPADGTEPLLITID